MTALFTLVTWVVLGMQAPAAPAQPTGLIVGRVVDAVTNTPVVNAVVSISGPGIGTRRVLVDGQGRFMASALQSGEFTISAVKRGHLDGTYGQGRPDGSGRPLHLEDGARVVDATIRMWRFATISGTVTDDAGEAVSGAQVQVWRRAISAGQWKLTPTGRTGSTDERGHYRIISLLPGDYALVITSLTSTLPTSLLNIAASFQTMDEAQRREFSSLVARNGTAGYVSDLSQGFATVRVGDLLLQGAAGPTVNDGRTVNAFPTVWYPAAATPAQASIVTLAPGDERTGIDIQMTLTATRRVSGIVTGPSGSVPWLSLRLVPVSADEVSSEVTTSLSASLVTSMTSSDASGAFTFLAVPEGQYILRALTTSSPLPEPPPGTPGAPRGPLMLGKDPTWWGVSPVSVGDDDVSGLALQLRPGLRITGRVEFEGTSTRPSGAALRSMRVSVEPAEGRTAWHPSAYQAQVTPEGEFYSPGLTAGRYVLRVDGAPAGWTVKSAIVSGRDMLDNAVTLENEDLSGLLLTFTDQPSRVNGLVRDDLGRPDPGAAVIVFPRDGIWTNLGASARRIRLIRPSRTGQFTLTGLPPGRYNIAAIDDASVSHWQDPAFLRRLAGVATDVTLNPLQPLSVNLTRVVVR
jgi:hypothetical protein